jgi:hypothetical protein
VPEEPAEAQAFERAPSLDASRRLNWAQPPQEQVPLVPGSFRPQVATPERKLWPQELAVPVARAWAEGDTMPLPLQLGEALQLQLGWRQRVPLCSSSERPPLVVEGPQVWVWLQLEAPWA